MEATITETVATAKISAATVPSDKLDDTTKASMAVTPRGSLSGWWDPRLVGLLHFDHMTDRQKSEMKVLKAKEVVDTPRRRGGQGS